MRLAWTGLCGVMMILTAGCGGEERASDGTPPIRYAPADDQRAADDGDGRVDGLPAGHPPVGGPARGDENVLRTGPSTISFPDAGVTFSVPTGWKELKLSGSDAQVIDARLAVPVTGQDGVEPQITLSRTGGGIRLNLDRWTGQFAEAAAEPVEQTISVDQAEATWIELRGSFQDPFRPRLPEHDDWAVIGVAIPLGGGRDFYVKMSGPRAAVESVRDEFRRFITSGRLR
ncbi:MAG TPA: hypothetical protein VML55_13145 [Planctomycetaceae bacterium]|nr:hypothetical protein [Planctomycetaceae bacterium]